MTEAEWTAFLQRPEIPAFNRAMLAAPDDDLPRLVFCDWLDESCPDSRICAVVRASMNGKSHPIRHLSTPTDSSLSAERGRLHLALEREQPPPEEHGCRALWESGWVGGLVLNSPSPGTIRAWTTHPGMASVDWLAAVECGMEAAEVIATADHLTELRGLNLSLSPLGLRGARELQRATLPALRDLTLYGCRLRDYGTGEIASTPAFGRLTDLDLGSNEIGPTGAQALATSPHLTYLQSLRLSHNVIGDDGATAIFNSPALASLRSLDLDENEIGSNGIQTLCDSVHLTGLTTLKLGNNRIGDEGVRALAASPHLARLHTLELSSCFDSPAGAVALTESSHLPELRSLDLGYNPIGDGGLILLAASPLFDRLDKLNLGECGITVAGLRALAASTRFADPRPLELWLSDNAFGQEVEAEADGFPPTLAAAVRNAVLWGIDMR